ncbi:Daunorubicin/doxorubicin resistance ATP-binding protein DrrA [compost metagenome]
MVYKQDFAHAGKYAINVDGVSKTLLGTKIIKNVSFHIPFNSIYAIIGPNGAGKTTLLRLITRLLPPDQGYIRYGVDEQAVSVLLENDYLFEAKTGIDNLRDFGIYLGVDSAQVESAVTRYAGLLQLNSALGRKVANYSKSMKRKLSLLITLLRGTDILILDELTSGVDPESRMVMRGVLQQLKAEGKTIVITSHDLAEVRKVSDWITILVDGCNAEVINNATFDGDLEKRFFDTLEELRS